MKALPLLLTFFVMAAAPSAAQSVHIAHDASHPQAAYGARMLARALEERGRDAATSPGAAAYTIDIALDSTGLGPEAFAIARSGDRIVITGGDGRGMIYGALALAEDLRNGIALDAVAARSEAPHLPFRGIKHNLPWDSYRPSSALDQHRETVSDLAYWEAFLDMMVANRFNVLSLWQLHPFSYMITARNFPEATPFRGEEMRRWQDFYRGIFRMAEEREIDTYLVTWSIFVSQEFSEAHDVALENFYPHYYADGDTSEIVRRYIRESVTQVLQEYPELDGFGVSHGEGMGGMTPTERQRWIEETYIEGMRQAGRPVKLIHRVPFSANLSSAGSTSGDTEQMTRDAMEALDFFEEPIWVEMKFNWSHAHSTPDLVKVHGGPLGDTYFVPEPRNYKVTWMARNEDFFALRWGAPEFIRQHVRQNGSHSYVGGYFVGSETYIPALDYFTAVSEPVSWRYAFERQWLFYKLWGRLLYDPDTPDAVFQAEFVRRYGDQAADLLRAFALASSTQLRLASLWDATWDFTLYSEGFLSLRGQTTEFISVDRLIDRGTMDPDYVSVGDYVERRASGESFEATEITPPLLIEMLERDSEEALRLVEGIQTAGNASLMYEVADVRTWSRLGLYLADKLRGAVDLATFRRTGDEALRASAVLHLENALGHWDEVIAITRPIYRDMPLTAYNGNYFTPNPDNLFHWALLRPDVAADVELARNSVAGER